MDLRGRTRVTRNPTDKKSGKSPSRKSPSRKSPSRKSPRRKSPSRKSPARKASPVRKLSPDNKPTAQKKSSRVRKAPLQKQASPARKLSPIRNKSPAEISKRAAFLLSKANLDVSPVKSRENILGIKELKSSTSSYQSVKTSSSIKTLDLTSSDVDSEIMRFTDLGNSLRSRFSDSTKSHANTPSATEMSRNSRSLSTSLCGTGEPTGTEYSQSEYSGSDTEIQYKSSPLIVKKGCTPISRIIQTPKEFDGLFGNFIMLLLVPAITFSINEWDLKHMGIEVYILYIGFQIIIYLLSCLPLGRTIKLNRYQQKFYFNTATIAILIAITYFIAERQFHIPVGAYILKNYSQFCLLAVVNAYIVGLWCYFRPKFYKEKQNLVNPYGQSGRFIIDYSLGKEIDPKWFNSINIKLTHHRLALLSMLIISITLATKSIKLPPIPSLTSETNLTTYENIVDITNYYREKISYDPNALTATVLLSLYAFDSIIFEHHLSNSFELQHEGCGALTLLRYSLLPYQLAAIPKFLTENKNSSTCFMGLILVSFIFISGLLLKRRANGIKYAFRMNEHSARFNKLEILRTHQDRNLLVGSLWGFVRQPNYTGELICFLSMTSLLIMNFAWPPFISISYLILLLFHRSIRVNSRNFDRYNSAWSRYCTKVKYIIIPKVF